MEDDKELERISPVGCTIILNGSIMTENKFQIIGMYDKMSVVCIWQARRL